MAMTDSHPVMERDLARRAGLGWFGKNTCLLDSKNGSFFLIGEILTSLAPAPSLEPAPDQCGTCRRCIDACPTQAITAPKELDARKCISYWTIEARGVPPADIRKATGAWFFGCDICQQVCPWNEKAFGKTLLAELRSAPADREGLLTELKWILTSSNNHLQRAFSGTPLTRAGGRGLKRNAILVAVHHGLSELKSEIDAACKAHPELEELGRWAAASL
jgi:epoxyqueuosine reductase